MMILDKTKNTLINIYAFHGKKNKKHYFYIKLRPNPQKTGQLVIFTEKILSRKLHFLCSVGY